MDPIQSLITALDLYGAMPWHTRALRNGRLNSDGSIRRDPITTVGDLVSYIQEFPNQPFPYIDGAGVVHQSRLWRALVLHLAEKKVDPGFEEG